jgi:hemoglobin
MRSGPRLACLAILIAAAGLLTVPGPTPAAQAGDNPLAKDIDAGLRDVINQGADIFNNQGDHAGCTRLYEGALRTVKPLLGGYPQLQKAIDAGIAEAYALPRWHDRAHALRKVLDQVRVTLNPGLKATAKTLWDRLGGEANVTKVVDEFIKTAAADPAVNFDRGGKIKLDAAILADFKKKMVTFISHVSGGPYTYTGKEMKDAHKGMGITDAEFNATAGHLKGALEKFGAKPADVDELLKAVATLRSAVVEKKNGDMKDKEPPPDPNMARISGKVTIDGEPLTHGFVTFTRTGGPSYSANVLKDGTFTFKKGFPPGEYTVTIVNTTTPPEPGEKRVPIPEKYSNPETSAIRFTAAKGLGVFDIILTAK